MRSPQSLRKALFLALTMLLAGLALSSLLLVFPAAAPATAGLGTTISLQAPSGEIPVESNITVTVRISDVKDLWALALSLDFPADKLQVIDADPSTSGVQAALADCPDPVLPAGFVLQNLADNTAGIISYAVTQLTPTLAIDGDCDALHILFQTVDGPDAVLHFNSVTLATLNGQVIPVTPVDRQLELEEAGAEVYLPVVLRK